MQSVQSTFTVESHDKVRHPASEFNVSWRKDLASDQTLFTIGESAINGGDIIGGENDPNPTQPDLFNYYDETTYLQSVNYQRALRVPQGGLSVGLFDAKLDNTSGRFTPRYMGGSSALFTAVLPERPVKIQAGFNYNSFDNVIPQFYGEAAKSPEVQYKNRTVKLSGRDYVDYLGNKYTDRSVMYTGVDSGTIIENLLVDLGYQTAEYVIDQGINNISFAQFDKGMRYRDIIDKIVQAEYGQFYQDESGTLRFENRSHWNQSPHTEVQTNIFTAQVIDAKSPQTSHIINVVEVHGKRFRKQQKQLVYQAQQAFELKPGRNEVFVDFEDPILELFDPELTANISQEGDGDDVTDKVYVKYVSQFAQSAKYVVQNGHDSTVFLTKFDIQGRVVKNTANIYSRSTNSASLTAYQDRRLDITNEYIQHEGWADSLGQQIADEFGNPENLQELKIRAIPELQLGDLITWQGRYWHIYSINATYSPSGGFTQDLKLLQRTIVSYFGIGSAIGGTDIIAP